MSRVDPRINITIDMMFQFRLGILAGLCGRPSPTFIGCYPLRIPRGRILHAASNLNRHRMPQTRFEAHR